MVRSPYDFIDGIDTGGDLALFTERVLRPLTPDDDLRLVCRLPSGTDVVVLAERLPWDSDFFGYAVARLDGIYALDPAPESLDFRAAVEALLEVAASRGI